MTTLEIWLTALALAMDSFTVAIAAGLILKRVQLRHFITIAFFFGAFQALMPLLGWVGSVYFYNFIQHYDHWIAFAILVLLGVKMIREGIQDEEDRQFDPTRLGVVLVLAVGVSIDALAVGISFTCIGMDALAVIAYPLVAIALVSFFMALGGCFIGSLVGNKLRFPVEPLGGVVLIFLGIKILSEHLM